MYEPREGGVGGKCGARRRPKKQEGPSSRPLAHFTPPRPRKQKKNIVGGAGHRSLYLSHISLGAETDRLAGRKSTRQPARHDPDAMLSDRSTI